MATPTRVLLIDDRIDVQLTLKLILRGFACEIEAAVNGKRALELIAARPFDVIFLDLKLPDLTGIEILQQARSLCSSLGKVIILTGQPEPGTQEQARELGAFRYLTKAPIDRAEIKAAFADAISGRA